ncbi:restriction endonuclease [Actinoplanes sp. CA-051413]|uniref:restriction endonuclease n=1 Tax=Actinoplanes sp. CA-051413 TaxID=3239899 RepID=UPI003D9857CF
MATNKRPSSGDLARWRQAQIRQAERDQRAAERAAALQRRAEADQYVASRRDEAAMRTVALEKAVEELTHLLIVGLRRRARINLQGFRREPSIRQFDPGPLSHPLPRPEWRDFEPPPPGALGGLFGGKARYETAMKVARRRYDTAQARWEQAETDRLERLAAARAAHDRLVAVEVADCAKQNQLIHQEIAGLMERRREPVERYLDQVLVRMPLPEDFPRRAEVAYNPDAEQVVVQLQLPGTDVVPAVKSVKYIQSGPNADTMPETRRPDKELKELYRDVIAQVALLAVRDLFDADELLRTVAFNGHVDTINRATGQREYPCLVSLNVERDKFEELILDRVSPADCLRHLNALVSPHPFALTPIQPVLRFDLSRFNFIKGFDAVATLDHRPDLMEMGHGEFEHLVRQIFEAMGMQGWTTTSSNDDGVDAVVVNPDPFVGGLTIVQAKHYKNVVGVSHIRELAGAMEEKRAGRGILVTTSWFTAGGWQKAHEHGRMQLVDGQHLTFLIKQHLDRDVLISVNRPRNAASGPPTTASGAT